MSTKLKTLKTYLFGMNSNIKCEKEMLYMSCWINNGVLRVKQVLKDGVWKEIEKICESFSEIILLSSFKLLKLNVTKVCQYLSS